VCVAPDPRLRSLCPKFGRLNMARSAGLTHPLGSPRHTLLAPQPVSAHLLARLWVGQVAHALVWANEHRHTQHVVVDWLGSFLRHSLSCGVLQKMQLVAVVGTAPAHPQW
jgi:hypothetical protein